MAARDPAKQKQVAQRPQLHESRLNNAYTTLLALLSDKQMLSGEEITRRYEMALNRN